MKVRAAPRKNSGEHLTADTTILGDFLTHPAFACFGRLILPWMIAPMIRVLRLRNLASLLPYHSHVGPDVVGALNHLIDDVNSGKTIFYEIYTADEKTEQRANQNLLVLLPGKTRSAVCDYSPGWMLFLCSIRA